MHALIDGDVIKYRCAFAAEKTKYLVEGTTGGQTNFWEAESHKQAKEQAGKDGVIWSRKVLEPVEFALQATKTSLEAILRGYESYTIFISGPTNFRIDLAVTRPYKGNRDRTKDPVYKEEVEKYLVREYGAVHTDGIEADDAIGIALSSRSDGCAVTNDKDLDQVPGWHHNFVSGETYQVSKRDADFALYTQLLSGDATDNIPGLEGIGQAKARKILDGSKSGLELCERAWAAYRNSIDSYEKAKTYFLEQLNLVFILRKPDQRAVMYLPTGFNFD